jgi:hypothetical protein
MTSYQPTGPRIAWTHQPASPRRTRHCAWPSPAWRRTRRTSLVPRPV